MSEIFEAVGMTVIIGIVLYAVVYVGFGAVYYTQLKLFEWRNKRQAR